MGKTIRAPRPRSYIEELNDTLTGQESIMPRLLALERQYTPLWQEVQKEALLGQQRMMNEVYAQQIPKAAELTGKYASAMAPALGQIGESARSAYEQTLDPSVRGILSTLGSQASEGLALGSALSDAENKQAQQAARVAMASRGMQTGNQAIALEALNTYNMGQARDLQRKQLASSIYGLGQSSAGQAMSMYGGGMLNAAQGFSPISSYQNAFNANQGLGPSLFRPESQYNAQLISSNRQEQMQAQMANAQRQAGILSGVLGLGGAFLGNPSLAGMFGGSAAGSTLGSSLGMANGVGFGSTLSTSQLAGGFNNTLMGGGANLSFNSGPMWSFGGK